MSNRSRQHHNPDTARRDAVCAVLGIMLQHSFRHRAWWAFCLVALPAWLRVRRWLSRRRAHARYPSAAASPGSESESRPPAQPLPPPAAR
jgi:hypothetical protein